MADQILSTVEQSQLQKQSSLRDLITNDYLEDTKNSNTIEIANLFFDSDVERAVQLNVWSNVFMTVSDIYAFFIWTPNIDIDIRMEKFSQDFISIWKAVASVVREGWKLKLQYLPAKSHIYSNGEHKTIRYYEAILEDKKAYFIFKQTYRVGLVINQLFQVQSLTATSWDLVPLDTIPQTSWLQEVTNTELDTLSIFVADDIQNSDDKNQSMVDKIKNLVYSLDRKQVMFETQFLKNIDQFIVLTNIDLSNEAQDSRGRIDFKKVWKVLSSSMHGAWPADIKFISNTNELIDEAIKYEQTQLTKVSSTTLIPLDFLWLTTSGTTSWSSRQIMISSFIKSVESKRAIIQKDFIEPILQLFISEGQKDELDNEITSNIFWEDVIPASGKEVADELKIARETWLISQDSAVKVYMWFNNDEEVQQEIAKINLDNNPEANASEWSESQSNS